MRIGLVGAGSQGANWARVIEQSDHELGTVIDSDLPRATALAETYSAHAAADLDALTGSDAVVLATTTDSHVALALDVLGRGLPLLVEKPLAANLEDSRAIVARAAEQSVPLMCGFVERFNPAIRTVMGLLDSPVLHSIALRHSPPDGRRKGDVTYDLLIHDLDLMLALAASPVKQIHAVLGPRGEGGGAEIADCVVQFDDGAIATLSASRLSQRKIRLWQVTTQHALYEVDLLRANVTVYSHVGHEIEMGAYRAQTIVDYPFVRHAGEPLALELEHFVSLVAGRGDIAAERAAILPPHEIAERVARL